MNNNILPILLLFSWISYITFDGFGYPKVFASITSLLIGCCVVNMVYLNIYKGLYRSLVDSMIRDNEFMMSTLELLNKIKEKE